MSATTATIGTTVAYSDMANPRRLAVVTAVGVGFAGSEFGLTWEDGTTSTSDLRQAGWELVTTVGPAHHGPLHGPHGRAVLLALAGLADVALDSPNGYSSSSAAQVGRIAGMAPATARRWLTALEAAGYAARPVAAHRPARHYDGWRVPEVAFS